MVRFEASLRQTTGWNGLETVPQELVGNFVVVDDFLRFYSRAKLKRAAVSDGLFGRKVFLFAILTEQARCIVTCFVYAYGVVDAVW